MIKANANNLSLYITLLLLTSMQLAKADVMLASLDPYIENNQHFIDASFDVELTDEITKALLQGIPIVLNTEIQILKKRKWFPDKKLKTINLRYELEHRPLTQDYFTFNFNNGNSRSFDDLDSALKYIGTINHFAVLDENLSLPDSNLSGRIRSYLDLDALPTPMKPQIYFSREWQLNSDWQNWELGK